jgi:hypothetical protein
MIGEHTYCEGCRNRVKDLMLGEIIHETSTGMKHQPPKGASVEQARYRAQELMKGNTSMLPLYVHIHMYIHIISYISYIFRRSTKHNINLVIQKCKNIYKYIYIYIHIFLRCRRITHTYTDVHVYDCGCYSIVLSSGEE